jgi:hypothetical protein
MLMYTRDMGRDFWFDFDNQTLWQRTAAVTAAVKAAYFDQGLSFDTMADALVASWLGDGHPATFRTRVQAGRDGIIALVDIQLQILDAHLQTPEDVRLAFEDFGQGVLFDDRPPRPPERHIHMMDGSPDNWVGFRRWFAILRAAELLDHPRPDAVAHLKRCVQLAWAIQSEADPNQTSPNNPGLPDARRQLLRGVWMPITDAVAEWAFATHQFRAPSPQEIENAGRYKAIQVMLNRAATDGNPDHGGEGRFWQKLWADFTTTSVFGNPLIAASGPDRGARSALVQVLQGTLAGMPQMPLDRPPLSPEQIAFISGWIDAGTPEI